MFASLDVVSLTRAAMVSRAWNGVASSAAVWAEFGRQNLLVTGVAEATPPQEVDRDWKSVAQAWHRVRRNWDRGLCRVICLEAHSAAVYGVRFDGYVIFPPQKPVQATSTRSLANVPADGMSSKKIITVSRDQTIRIWCARTYRCLKIIGGDHVSPATISIGQVEDPMTDPQSGVTTIGYSLPDQFDTLPHIGLDFQPGPRAWHRPDIRHSASILCLQFDDEILVTGSSDSTCIVWSIRDDYEPVRRLIGHNSNVLDVAFDSQRIVSASKDLSLRVWNRHTGAPLHNLHGHSAPVNAVKIRENVAYSTAGDGRAKLWNLETGACLRTLRCSQQGLACIQPSDDGRFILTGGNDKLVRLWEVETGRLVREFNAHTALVRSLCFDNANGRIVSCSYDETMKVWDIESGRLVLNLPRRPHGWYLSAQSDYRRIVATTYDDKINVVDFGHDIPGVGVLEGLRVASR